MGKEPQSIKEYRVLRGLNKERDKILGTRNKQYSDKGYVDNFVDTSMIAQILGIKVSPSEVAKIIAILKFVRNENGIRSGQDANARRDHIIDVVNYIDLAYLCEIEDERIDKMIREIFNKADEKDLDVDIGADPNGRNDPEELDKESEASRRIREGKAPKPGKFGGKR